MSLKICRLVRLASSFANLGLVPSKMALKRLDLSVADSVSRTSMKKSLRPMLRLFGKMTNKGAVIGIGYLESKSRNRVSKDEKTVSIPFSFFLCVDAMKP
ncbi:hypothetical protein COLO4_06893 [Corchorus olitorius]|uniref:Uncharacterized protein n=1 Tax=Corchorus olitorius TaxID=93759 RepID=A0A1R3KLK8_9ROSI|nr:hypothetical protein COLO4_06893 [Corchorus olitorius]